MSDTVFFAPSRNLSLAEAAEMAGATIVNPAHASRAVAQLRQFQDACDGSLVFADGKEYGPQLAGLPNCAILCTEALAASAPDHVAVLVAKRPQQAFARIGRALFPDSVKPASFSGTSGISAHAVVHESARVEPGATIEAGAVIGAGCEIGADTLVGPRAVIANGCKVGRGSVIGPGVSIANALIGNRVVIHAGACIGQDGFGFVPGERGLEKMPHLGRVIIQDDVEIGANTTVDRGALADTVIGEGTKIDNLVQIAHNVRIGRNCVIAGHCGLSGSSKLGDGVMLGGRVGLADHVSVGDGAQIAAAAGVMTDIPAGGRWAGAPAQPIKDFFREVAVIRGLVRDKKEKRT